MRIVFLMPTYYPDTFGGAERQTRILTRALRRKGANVTILAPTMVPEAAGTVDEGGIPVIRFHVRHPVFLGGRYLASMLAWWALAFLWLVRNRGAYDVISIQHVRLHAWPGLLAGILFRKTMSAKLGRGGDHFELRRLPAQKLPFGRLVVAMAKRSRLVFVANSVEIVSDLHACGIADERIARIANGVECPAKPMARYRGADGRQSFVYAGRFETEKGVGILADAFGAFAAPGEISAAPAEISAPSGHRVALTLFGDGSLRDDLVRSAGRSTAVHVNPVTDDRDAIFGGAAFMVLPSESEGMSNTLLEAMAYGVVPIVTNVSGAGDLVVHGETGLILARSDPDAIRTGLAEASALDEEAWRAMSAAARRRIVERFSIEAIADAYLALYGQLGAGRAGAPAGTPGRWTTHEVSP